MKVDLRTLTFLCEMTQRPEVKPEEVLALIRVARAAKEYLEPPFMWRRYDALRAALSDIEDSKQ